ncbi:recombinase family protein [Paracoccus pantotrophus]|uniref:recombinase family protein n=1 Tax=Paracoccus pantotrophus TaxID=82367 RepID=UPI000E09A07D|nr:recombinase family protein [Paracoccus pantotrophus]RDD96185.1 recombinase family protein [Paracoccus pantotrophus]WGR65114.1 recombinase family protein [Paracoccus pantotrophus]
MIQTPPLRAAIYARYSSDQQREASIEDQLRICRRLIESKSWTIAEVYSDAAMSGASALRPEYQKLQDDARRGRIDVVVSESLDRISRDQEHIAGFYKQMSFLGIPLITVAEGEISELHIGLKGTMSALYLKDLAQKTHRGLEGRVRDGKSAGGISYGYKVHRELRADGTLTTGERVIDPNEAAIVTRIFTEYAAGRSARTIAAALNDEGIPSPDSGKGNGTWGPSTISGNWKRGTGILNNELYIGRLIWNRQSFPKDPKTQKRQARMNPPEEWVIEEVPELRILSDDLWQQAKDRQGAIRADMNPAGVQSVRLQPERARRPDYLFSGLVKCGCCGASYTLINKTRYGCAAARNKGEAICTNRATIQREEVESRVLAGLREKLLHPELIAAFIEEYRRAFNEAAGDRSSAQDQAKRDLKQVEKKITGILAAIEDGMYHPSMKTKMADLETRKTRLTAFLEDTPEPPALRLHPRLSDLYREKIENLSAALKEPGMKLEATQILRSLIAEIRMVPETSAPGGHEIELLGELAGILALSETDTTKPPHLARARNSVESVKMVAGADNHLHLPPSTLIFPMLRQVEPEILREIFRTAA